MKDEARTAAPILRGTGIGTRLSFSVVVLANVALAVAVAAALTWLVTRPGLRARLDLTSAGANTLDVSTRGVLDNLPEDAELQIDVFFRPLDSPLERVGAAAQARMYHVLKLAEEYRPGKVRVTDHGIAHDPERSAVIEERMRELGVRALNVVVLSNGPRHEVLRLLGDVAEIDLGNPIGHRGQYQPPTLVAFRGEEALLRGILKVTRGEAPKALFVWGHGQRDLYGEDERGMGRLHTALLGDGFSPARWVPDEDGRVPADCAVLALIGPTDPLTDEEVEWIREYVERGGRLIVAPGHEAYRGPGSVAALLPAFGIELGRGIVAQPVVDHATGGELFGHPRCSALILRSSEMAFEHPITRSLRLGDRRVRLMLSHPLGRGASPPGGALLDLLKSSERTWEDLPDAMGVQDWIPSEGERVGPFSLAMTSVFPPPAVGPAISIAGTIRERPESRVLAFGAADLFANLLFESNRDLLLNSFNWAAGREYRVSISPRDPDLRRLDLSRGRGLFGVNLAVTIGLPALCLLLGLVTAWRRRR